MNAATIAQLIVLYGIPLTDKLVTKWLSGTPITEADWNEIRELAKSGATDRMKLALALAGVPLDSQKAKELLALTGA